MHTEQIAYSHDNVILEGFAAYPAKQKCPVVILCHGWRGKDDFICAVAEQMAQWGYIGFALDMYGKGVLGNSKQENAALKKPFIEDRDFLLKRLLKGYEAARILKGAEINNYAVVGFGFGGICALDLARSGADLRGAVSIYGHLDSPGTSVPNISAKILVFHGYNDPLVSLDELHNFEKEMESCKADWQTHVYGNTQHAFMLPTALDPSGGTVYNPIAAARTEVLLQSFLEEIFIHI